MAKHVTTARGTVVDLDLMKIQREMGNVVIASPAVAATGNSIAAMELQKQNKLAALLKQEEEKMKIAKTVLDNKEGNNENSSSRKSHSV